MPRTTKTLLVAMLLLAGLAACGSDDGGAISADDADTATTAAETADTAAAGGGGEAGPGAVEIVDFAFAPAELTVAAGTTVTWTNQDDAVHSIADSALDEESDDMAQGDTFEITYDEPGEYPYVCGIHNYMKGTVTVE